MVGCRHCSLLLLPLAAHLLPPILRPRVARTECSVCRSRVRDRRRSPTGHQQRPHSVEVIRDGRPRKDIIATTITQTDDDTCTWAGLGVNRGASSASD